MKRFASAAAAAAVSLLMWHGSASADLIGVDAGWYGFCFGGSGSAATAGCQNDGIGVSGNSTTFTATGPVAFRVTDAFQKGDTFKVTIDGTDYFTPVVPVDGAGSTTNPDLAFADPTYSHISVLLGAGAHTVDIFSDVSPFGGGGAYLSAVSVPEPASLALLGVGLAGLAFVRRRKTA